MTKQELFSLLNNSGNLLEINIDSLKNLVSKYPYCSVFHMLLVKKMQLDEDSGFQKQLNLTATISPARKALFNYLKSPVEAVPEYVKLKQELDAADNAPDNSIEITEEQIPDTDSTSKYHQLIADSPIAGTLHSESSNDNFIAENKDIDSEPANKETEIETEEKNPEIEKEDNLENGNSSNDVTERQTDKIDHQDEESSNLATIAEEEDLDVIYEEVTLPETEPQEELKEEEPTVEHNTEEQEQAVETEIEEKISKEIEETNQEEAIKQDVIEVEPAKEIVNSNGISAEPETIDHQQEVDKIEEEAQVEAISNQEEPLELELEPEQEEIIRTESEQEEIIKDVEETKSEEIEANILTESELANSVLDFTGDLNIEINNDPTATIASIHEVMFLSENEIPYEESDTKINDGDEEVYLSFSDWLNKGKPITVPESVENESLPMIKVRKRKKKMKKNKIKAAKSNKEDSKKKKKKKVKIEELKNSSKKKKKGKKKKDKIKAFAKISVSRNEDIVAENLASILVAQGKIKEAKTMYKKLILKFPEKSTFFAQKLKDIKKEK